MANQTCINCKHYQPRTSDYGQCVLTEKQRPRDTQFMVSCTPDFKCNKWKKVK